MKKMASKEVNKVLNKKDIDRLAFDSMLLQAGFNYERMQASGFLQAQLPALKKIYKDDKEGLSAAMKDNLEFINTHPNLVGFLMGLLISMEESHEDRATIKGLKVALFAPLAGIGDAIFWFTLLPIVAGICASMAMEGSLMGPILFFLVYLVIFLMRWFWTRLGYNLGTKAVTQITSTSEILAKAATVLGCTVIGGLIASYVSIDVQTQIVVNEAKTVSLQTDFFDMIFPNILSIGYVFLMYYFLTKKKASPVVLILVTFVLSIVLSFFGIL
jgi:PTS system galactosamine-specific IID component